MLFNSVEFAIFVPAVFFTYWYVLKGSFRAQNLFLLAASYLFYGWWDWRFLSLILISSLVDYIAALGLARSEGKAARRALLFMSLAANLGMLGFFKYYNFFVDSFVGLFASFGVHLQSRTLNVILPVGISFYTFQTLSYTLDVYRRRLEPTRDFVAFFAFVSFFPQLVAGPIERASNLLPQFLKPRRFERAAAVDGLRQMLFGLFKKIVIADGCGVIVDKVFAGFGDLGGSTLLVAIVCFAFQIYADFSGYSDVAIGVARLLGFDLMRNFAYPYFARDIAEFWRRWHISLSTWFRDYVFIPLGGSRGDIWRTTRNIIITFTVSGLWHGANWTFVVWGFLNGVYYIPIMLRSRQKAHVGVVASDRWLPSAGEAAGMAMTFGATLVAWVFFRADTLGQAVSYLNRMFSATLFSLPSLGKKEMIWIALLAIFEWMQRKKQHALQVGDLPVGLRWALYWGISYALLSSFSGGREFIYFQF